MNFGADFPKGRSHNEEWWLWKRLVEIMIFPYVDTSLRVWIPNSWRCGEDWSRKLVPRVCSMWCVAFYRTVAHKTITLILLFILKLVTINRNSAGWAAGRFSTGVFSFSAHIQLWGTKNKGEWKLIFFEFGDPCRPELNWRAFHDILCEVYLVAGIHPDTWHIPQAYIYIYTSR